MWSLAYLIKSYPANRQDTTLSDNIIQLNLKHWLDRKLAWTLGIHSRIATLLLFIFSLKSDQTNCVCGQAYISNINMIALTWQFKENWGGIKSKSRDYWPAQLPKLPKLSVFFIYLLWCAFSSEMHFRSAQKMSKLSWLMNLIYIDHVDCRKIRSGGRQPAVYSGHSTGYPKFR